MTELQALNKSIKLWKWLVLNFPAQKHENPDYDKIKSYLDDCPLCEKYRIMNMHSYTACKGCCLNKLKKTRLSSVILCCESYHIWTNSSDPKLSLKAAEKILNTMIKRRDKIKGAKI